MAHAGIYISIPFCRQKCSYCNFASGVHPAGTVPRYLGALSREISLHNDYWKIAGVPPSAQSIDSIYMGGGTPGMLSGAQLEEIIRTIRASFPVAGDAEITIEASPENVNRESAKEWANCGINRVSLGVQSMVEKEIRAVGRMHDEQTVEHALSFLRKAGIEDISVDLIAGLPHQTLDSWGRSVDGLLALHPSHFSVYMLEVDDDSRLGGELQKGGSKYHAAAVPTEADIAEFYLAAMKRLRSSGYEHYEISNFARQGRRSRHNLKYWTNAPYFGFGSDAHSYDGERRWANADSVTDYCSAIENSRSPIVDMKTLDREEQLEERMFLGLRCRDGVSFSALNAEFARLSSGEGSLLLEERFEDTIREFRESGWLESTGDCLRLTDQGVLFSNEVFAGFIGTNE